MSADLFAALTDPRADVRRGAVLRAPEGSADDPAVRAAVLGALHDPVWCVREAAALRAGRFPDPDGTILAMLVGLTLRDSSPHVRLAAATVIGPHFHPDRDYSAAATHRFERQRVRAAVALGHVAPERAREAVALLAGCVADSHPKVRLVGLRALARVEPVAVLPVLPLVVRKCAETDPDIAAAAREVWERGLAVAEALRPLRPYPGTTDLVGANAMLERLPAGHPLRSGWDALPPLREEELTAPRFAKHLATVCQRVLTSLE